MVVNQWRPKTETIVNRLHHCGVIPYAAQHEVVRCKYGIHIPHLALKARSRVCAGNIACCSALGMTQSVNI